MWFFLLVPFFSFFALFVSYFHLIHSTVPAVTKSPKFFAHFVRSLDFPNFIWLKTWCFYFRLVIMHTRLAYTHEKHREAQREAVSERERPQCDCYLHSQAYCLIHKNIVYRRSVCLNALAHMDKRLAIYESLFFRLYSFKLIYEIEFNRPSEYRNIVPPSVQCKCISCAVCVRVCL